METTTTAATPATKPRSPWYCICSILRPCLALGFIIIPASKDESTISDRRIDCLGIFSFCARIVRIILYLAVSPASGWASAKTLAPFHRRLGPPHRRCLSRPDHTLHIWYSLRLVASCLIIVYVSAGLNAMVYFSSMLFQNVHGYPPPLLRTSLNYIVHGDGGVFANILFTKALTKVWPKIVMVIEWLFFIASGIVFARVKAYSSYWSYPLGALLMSCMGMTPVWLCYQINSVADANDEDRGVVGAVYYALSPNSLEHP
ncbi:hypothetical protein BGX30_013076 [Mortierella sp. GBA39]|nr:hypothetical protein BGX30_013076 [Mortierella sp. GBA39]